MSIALYSSLNQSSNRLKHSLSAAALAAFWVAPAMAQATPEAPAGEEQSVDAPQAVEPDQPAGPQEAQPYAGRGDYDRIIVTARKVEEDVQDVPIALNVIGTDDLEDSGANNIGQLASRLPSFQFTASNPRNTAFNVRGLGASFGLTNDGLENGVGFYIDEVYYTRPSAASFDFVDVERIELLRGPQGTLFGKNTTAGAVNIISQRPRFSPEGRVEVSIGDYQLAQAKGTLTGPLTDNIAGRLTFSSTSRRGTIKNFRNNQKVNEQGNLALKGSLLWRPTEAIDVLFSTDYARQETECCTQVYVTVGDTLKPSNLEFEALAAAAGYTPPSRNPFNRVADVDSDIQANQDFYGAQVNVSWDLGPGTLTSITAWRAWDWYPQNDRDYMGIPVLTKSSNQSYQDQYTQEIRYASNGDNVIDYQIGVYAYRQEIEGNSTQEYGGAATRWLNPTNLALPANLLTGYGSFAKVDSSTDSYAVFGQLTWDITEQLALTAGIRYTDETKEARFNQNVYGGLAPANAAETSARNSAARAQFYTADYQDASASGLVSAAYEFTPDILAYATYSQGFKSGGINLAGLPLNPSNAPALNKAVVEPEDVTNVEFGLKTQWYNGILTVNLAAFDNTTKDYQTTVVDNSVGAVRGYLANIEEVGVTGFELDATLAPINGFSGYFSIATNDGKYNSFANGPCPLELIAASTVACDLSGKRLPGVSEFSAAAGGEYAWDQTVATIPGEGYLGFDYNYRSDFYSDPSDSRYTLIDGYGVLNARLGFRSDGPWEFSVWAKNLLDEEYLQFVSLQFGNTGLVLGNPGDPRTVGATLRARY